MFIDYVQLSENVTVPNTSTNRKVTFRVNSLNVKLQMDNSIMDTKPCIIVICTKMDYEHVFGTSKGKIS
jgi:uncharacterized membrane protein YjjP (DUF1212 family)